MRFQIHNPKGKLRVPGQSYFLLTNKPLRPNPEVWFGQETFGFRVVPDKPIDEDEFGYIYASPRQVVTNCFTCEFATDPDWQIRTIYKE